MLDWISAEFHRLAKNKPHENVFKHLNICISQNSRFSAKTHLKGVDLRWQCMYLQCL